MKFTAIAKELNRNIFFGAEKFLYNIAFSITFILKKVSFNFIHTIFNLCFMSKDVYEDI